MENCLYPERCEQSYPMSPVGWLNDNLIIAVQNLLKKQSPILEFRLGQSMGFKIQQGEFIQILRDG